MKWLRILLPLVLCVAIGAATAQQAMAQPNTDCTAESWIPVGGGLPDRAFASAVMNNDLYVIHKSGIPASDPFDTNYRLSKWDGSSWSTVSALTVHHTVSTFSNGQVRSLVALDGQLYLGGRFSSVNGIAGTNGIARWDGTSWSAVNGGIADAADVTAMTVHNGKLHLAYGDISVRTPRYQIVALNGTSWDKLGGFASDWGMIYSILSWKGDLYASGQFSSIGGVTTGSVAKWDGTAWSAVGSISGGAQRLIAYNDNLILLGQYLYRVGGSNRHMLRWDGSTWTDGTSFDGRDLNVIDAKVHNNQIFVVATDDSALVDPNSGLGANFVRRFDGNTWTKVSNFDKSPNFLIEHNGYLFAGGAFASSCGTQVGHVAQLCDDQSCGRISGNIYWDKDADCVKGSGEPGVLNRIVEILPGPQYANTDADGNYMMYVLPGSYTVGLVPFLHWNQICPAASGTHSADVAGTGKSVSGLDFGTQPIPNIRDLRVSLAVGRARAGRPLLYSLTYTNVGTVTMNGTVSFMHDPRLTFDSSQAAPSRYTHPLAQWDFTDLEMGESRTIKIYTTVPRSAPMGENFCSGVSIDPQVEQMEADNRDTTCVPVTGGYDPNDIRVSPAGMEDNGEITARDTVLTYFVRFQNTGNDTAFKVVVVDTLAGALNPKSITLGAASHPYEFSMAGNGILTWTFDNIMLPDSTTSEPNSQGFFKFSVHLMPSLAVGTQIPNRVSIYFDYNAPVATNTVISIIGGASGVTPDAASTAFSLFPNPAHGMFYLDAQMSAGARVTVSNLLGQSVRSYTYDGSGRMELNVSDLPAGAYWISIPTAKGTMVERVTVVR